MSSTQSSTPKRERPNYDLALKRMLSLAHDDFLRLIAPEYTWKAELSPELPATLRQADLIWEVVDAHGERGLLHIELQTHVEANMGERMAEYGIRLWLREHLPLRSVVVFLNPSENVPESPFRITWGSLESLRYDYDVVKLWEVPAERVLATTSYALWPLSAVMGDATLEIAVSVAERIAVAPLPPHERGELTSLLVALSDLRLGRRRLLEMLRRHPVIEDILRESSLAEEFRDEGMREGMRDSLQVVLEARFGVLDEKLLAAIQQLAGQQLHELIVLSAKGTLEEVRERLGLS